MAAVPSFRASEGSRSVSVQCRQLASGANGGGADFRGTERDVDSGQPPSGVGCEVPPAAVLRRLGRADDWIRQTTIDVESLEARPSPFAATADPEIAVLTIGDEVKALCRRCPHRGEDLTVYGKLNEIALVITCRHARYEWSAESGLPTSSGSTGTSGALVMAPIHHDRDGEVWTSLEAARR